MLMQGYGAIGLLDAAQFVEVAVGGGGAAQAADEVGGGGEHTVEAVRCATRPRWSRQEVPPGPGAGSGGADVAAINGIQVVEREDVEPVDRGHGDHPRLSP